MKLIKFSFGLLALTIAVFALVGYLASRHEPTITAASSVSDGQPRLSEVFIPQELRYDPSADRFAGKRVPMVARPFNAAPGAIVCRHFDRVGILFHLYSKAWERRMIGGEDESPYPQSIGCILLKPGTRLEVYDQAGMPSIVAVVDGVKIQGVTMPQMVGAN